MQPGYYCFICKDKANNYKMIITMKEFLKNLGAIILLIGVIVLAVPAIGGGMSNTILATGLLLIVVGYISFIVINKKVE